MTTCPPRVEIMEALVILLALPSSTKLQESLYCCKALLWGILTFSVDLVWIAVDAPVGIAITAMLRTEIPNPLGRKVSTPLSAGYVKRSTKGVTFAEGNFG